MKPLPLALTKHTILLDLAFIEVLQQNYGDHSEETTFFFIPFWLYLAFRSSPLSALSPQEVACFPISKAD